MRVARQLRLKFTAGKIELHRGDLVAVLDNRHEAQDRLAALCIAMASNNGRGRYLAMDDIAGILWPDPDAMPDYFRENIRVVICRTREIFAKVGIDISVRYRHGYFLEEAAEHRMAA